MATVTGYVTNGRGSGDFALSGAVCSCCDNNYNKNVLSLPSNITSASTLRIWTDSVQFFQNQQSSGSRTSTFYLCDANGNNRVKILELTLAGGEAQKSFNQSWYPVNFQALAGKTLYGIFVSDNPNKAGVSYKNAYHFSIDYSIGSPVTAGNIIKATDRSQLGIATSAGNVISDSHFSANTIATASGFNSAYGL